MGKRITPTCVGKRRPAFTGKSDKRDHSHVCGKKAGRRIEFLTFVGTLPRVWEKVRTSCTITPRNRYTPTCVGKRIRPGQNQIHGAVHSHVCGKKPLDPALRHPVRGTLPRVWEKAEYADRLRAKYGYTPTCVGKSINEE